MTFTFFLLLLKTFDNINIRNKKFHFKPKQTQTFTRGKTNG